MPTEQTQDITVKSKEIIAVDKSHDKVCCTGGSETSKHPAVYYSFGNKDTVRCKYCDRVFVRS